MKAALKMGKASKPASLEAIINHHCFFMLTQLTMPIPLSTPKGNAWAVAIIDYGPHWDLLWVTFVKETGECWTFNNKDIRQEENYTFGLRSSSPANANSYQANNYNDIVEPIKKTKNYINNNI